LRSYSKIEGRVKAAIIIRRIGPYHAARLAALEKALSGALIAVEVAATDDTYDWEAVDRVGVTTVRRTLFETEAAARSSPLWSAIHETFGALKPDVVAIPGWADPAALAALAWCRDNRAATVLMSDSSADDAPRVWWRELIKRSIVKACDAAFVAGTPHRRYMEKLGMPAQRIVTGYDVVDNDYFAERADYAKSRASELRSELGLPPRYILCPGRFVEKKNLFRLLDAQALLAKADPANVLPLVFVGSGPLEQSLRARIAEPDFAGHAVIKPFAQYETLPFIYGLAEGFVIASVADQWGLVINEAMASGLPVLASSRCGAAVDLVIEGETGFLADPFDVASLANGLLKLATLPADARARMGRAGRDHIANWSPESFAAAFVRATKLAISRRKERGAGAFVPKPYLKAIAALQ
jgi:glycosyltransferase involved in cell wall biosynthesis